MGEDYIERSVVERSVLEECWREVLVLDRSAMVGEKSCRGVLEKSVGEESSKGSVGEQCCREVL